MQTWLSYLIDLGGYCFAVIIGGFCITWVVNTLWSAPGLIKDEDKKVRPFVYTSYLVGVVERTLYVASLQFGRPEFIAVWLAVKVAGQWKNWEENVNVDSETIPGRVFYNLFLIGTGFSIAYAFVGFLIISNISSHKSLVEIIFPPIFLLLGTVVFWGLTKYYQRKYSRKIATPDNKSAKHQLP